MLVCLIGNRVLLRVVVLLAIQNSQEVLQEEVLDLEGTWLSFFVHLQILHLVAKFILQWYYFWVQRKPSTYHHKHYYRSCCSSVCCSQHLRRRWMVLETSSSGMFLLSKQRCISLPPMIELSPATHTHTLVVADF